ncbi:MAG: ATP cone domain-containing protein [Candidatus Pacearchaeota archaeon]
MNNFRLSKVRKRDGRIVDFDEKRIRNAVYKAMISVKEKQGIVEGDLEVTPQMITQNVLNDLVERAKNRSGEYIPDIEEIQSIVERNLILSRLPETSIEFITYRRKRNEVRRLRKNVPEDVRELFLKSSEYFKDNPLGEFIYYRTYSRWLEDKGRRETWIETVDRYMNFMKDNLESRLSEDTYEEIRDGILNHRVMPSMRLLWSAGKAAESSNVAAYNCSYTTITNIKDFSEVLYILMCGTGVGFSVENQFIQQLPIIQKQKGIKLPTHVVEDSKEGWAKAFNTGLEAWFSGHDIDFDYSKLRPAGARLKTMGGRSSGPEALRILMDYSREKILSSQGKRLNSLAIHDLLCKVGEIVVVGGVRRSAEISHSDLDDLLMRSAKVGNFFLTHPERMMANNSAVYEHKPTAKEFMAEWLALAESGTGERGIFNRGSLRYTLPERRLKVIGDEINSMGTNPCGEILLKSKQFCNLTEVVARKDDTLESLLKKVELATILGTYQATLVNFPYLSSKWKDNCEQEALLGVSITGILDSPLLRDPDILNKLREHAVEVNKHYSKILGINPSTCITCVKPSGTVSKLVNSSPGVHPRWSEYYIQNIRISSSDPLFFMLKDQKYPYFPEIGQSMGSATTYVIPFPVKSPHGAILRKDLSAIDQLENWKRMKVNYTEHNPSVSIYIGEDEWLDAGQWVYNNWNIIGGLAFFPKDDHVYPLAPFEEVTKEKYYEVRDKLPKIDFSQLMFYEENDQTYGAREYACVSGKCDLM